MKALRQVEDWTRGLIETTSAYWTRFQLEIQKWGIPQELLLGIIHGVQKDMLHPGSFLQIKTWAELNDYCQGVAGDVGCGVLYILGATTTPTNQMSQYAQMMGRCVQYLNIMRDLQSDFQNHRVYVPLEFLKTLGIEAKKLPEEQLPRIRDELFQRAMNYREQAQVYSWKCFPAELMVNMYAEASRAKWRKGDSSRLTNSEKLKALISASFIFLKRKTQAARI